MAGWKVLVLEDDVSLREVLAAVLRDEGYEVTVAGAAAEAIAVVQAQPVDLVVTDVRMEGMDGLAALSEARALQPELDSLVVSGWTTEAETLRALSLKVGGFLKKPFTLADFLTRVRDLLEGRRRLLAGRETARQLTHSLWWALEQAGARHAELGDLAFYLAHRLRLGEGLPQTCRLAAMALAVGPAWLEGRAGWSDDRLGLAPLIEVVRQVRGAVHAAPELAAQVILATRHLLLEEPAPAWPWDERLAYLLAAEGERLRDSPQVLAAEALRSLELAPTSTRLRGLVGLAHVLEERQDWNAAERAYTGLAAQAEDPELKVKAAVGRSRCLMRRGDEWYAELKAAELASRALGPVHGAQQRWEIGKLLREAGHPSAPAYLAALEPELARLGLDGPWAKARLARATLEPQADPTLAQAVEVLIRPERLGELSGEGSWLVGALLSAACRCELPSDPWWCRLASEFPQPTLAWCETRAAAELTALLAALQAFPERVSERFLQGLAAHPDPAVSRGLPDTRGALEVPLRLRSFGYFEIFVNGERVKDSDWKSQKYKYVLAYLAARRGQRVPEEQLIEEFWPEQGPSARQSVYAATTNIRRCLRLREDSRREVIVRSGETLALDPELACWHDHDEFTRGVTGDPARTRSALDLFTGPYLQGCYLDWAVRERDHLDEVAAGALVRLAGETLESRPAESLDYAQRVLQLDPLSQPAHALRMRAFLGLGQPEKAIGQYQLCVDVLRRELALEPATSLVELYHRARLAQP